MDKTSLLLLVSFIAMISCDVLYPKNKDIEKFPKDKEPKSIVISSLNELNTYLKNYDHIIAVFHMDWCGHCRHFLPIFDDASSYQMVKKWKFLKINCNQKEICNKFGVDRFPTIKVYDKGNLLPSEPQRELAPLLEFLEKVSSEPMIKIKDVNTYLSEYGTFSPYVEYSEDHPEFISCVSMLAKTDFKTTYYFGIKEIKDEKQQKLVFDFDNMNMTYIWDGNCDNVRIFLEQNVYPLVSQINIGYIRKLQKNAKKVFMLFYNESNDKQKEFALTELKQISYNNRQMVFGYMDPSKDSMISSYFKIKSKPSMQIVVYDFSDDTYYTYPKEIDVTNSSSEKAKKEIEEMISSLNTVTFTTGNFFNDFMIKIGMKKVIPYTKYIILFVVIIGVLAMMTAIILCDKDEDLEKEAKENKEKKLNKPKVE